MHWFLAISLIAVFVIDRGLTKIPDFIHTCNLNDATCVLKSTRDAIPEFCKGLPEYGVPPMDPFYIDKLSIGLPGLKVSFYNSKVTGLRKFIVDESYYKDGHLNAVFHGNITLKGKYEMDGKILTFPINGKGDTKIKMINVIVKFVVNTNIMTDDKGVEHFTAKDYKYSFDYGVGSRVIYNMTNLFEGNQELSNTVLTFLNENWKLVADEFGKPFINYAIELAVSAIEKFFLAIPYQELIDGPLPV